MTTDTLQQVAMYQQFLLNADKLLDYKRQCYEGSANYIMREKQRWLAAIAELLRDKVEWSKEGF